MLSINTLVSGAQTLYKLAEDFKDNRKQLTILAADIKATTDAVQSKQDQFFDSTDGKIKRGRENQTAVDALRLLKSCIDDAKSILEELKDHPQQSNTKKFIKFFSEFARASGYKEEIATLYKNLNAAKQTLNLAVTLHQEQCQAALQADVYQISQQVEEVEKQISTQSTQLGNKLDDNLKQMAELRQSFNQLRQEFAKPTTTGPKQTVRVEENISDSDIKTLNIEGDETITLENAQRYGSDSQTMTAFMKIKQQEADHRKMLSSGVVQSVTSKSMQNTKVYAASFINQMTTSSSSQQNSSTSTHTPTVSSLTGPGSSATFALSRSGRTGTSNSCSCSSSSSSSVSSSGSEDDSLNF